MSRDNERLRQDVQHNAGRIIVICRQLATTETSGAELARLKQLKEYAELVVSEASHTDRCPPNFAGRVE
jgi:hypothetical protein